jgi:hypothetical protein
VGTEVNRCPRLTFEDRVADDRNDADDFDAFARPDIALRLRAKSRYRIVFLPHTFDRLRGELEPLSNRFCVRPKLLRQCLINQCHGRSAALRSFSRCERAAPQHWQRNTGEKVSAHAVRAGAECPPLSRGGCGCVGLRMLARLLDALRQRDHAEWHSRSDAGVPDSGQRAEPFLDRAVKCLRLRCVVTAKTCVDLDQHGARSLQSGGG